MKSTLKLLLAGITLAAFGIAMIETPFTGGGESSIAAKIAMPIFGIMFLFVAWFFLEPAIENIKGFLNKRNENQQSELLNNQAEPKDMFSIFRADYADFLSDYAVENPKVQNDITQFFRNILELKRNRLQKLNIMCRFKSARKNYSEERPPVTASEFSDGKYMIKDVTEGIAASTEYSKNGRIIYSQTCSDIAHYTVAGAKYLTSNEIVCPNCGSTQTKEQLLDGCDYCGTKFMVEDLDEKISDFALRSDYEVQYSRYKGVRKKLGPYVWLGTEAVVCFCYIVYFIFNFKEIMQESGTGFFSSISLGLLSCIIAAMPFAFIAMALFFSFVFPIIQLGASFNYVSQKILDKQRKAERSDTKMQERVRAFDPYFSISSFYSNIQNKLASVHFAENAAQINAFAACDLSGLQSRYKNVIDIQTDYISLRNYTVENGLQKALVEAVVKLVSLNGEKCSVSSENIKLLCTKSAECKTQIVCSPYVMKCRGCGASISLLEGKTCSYCGTEIDLEKHDWVIREYTQRKG